MLSGAVARPTEDKRVRSMPSAILATLRKSWLPGALSLIGIGALLVSSPALGADLGAARSFVTALYSHYPAPKHGPEFDPTGRSAGAVFDPGMVAMLREDKRLTQPGDEGAIEADPLCACQDDSGLKADIGDIHPVDASHASAAVTLHFRASRPPETIHVTLDLVDVQGQWRIHDISTKDMPSLRTYLAKSNLEAAKGRK